MTHAEYIESILAGNWPDHPAVPAGPTFIDERGRISNLILGGQVASVAIISSLARTLRSNHFHRTDWHILHVLEGVVDYYWRPVGSDEKPRCQLFARGDSFFTPPMVEHATYFPAECTLLSLARNSRDHASHEADLVRVKLVSLADAQAAWPRMQQA